MEIAAVTRTDPHILDALNRLLPQLSANATHLSREALAQIVDSACSTLFVATEGKAVIGSLILVLYRIPSRLHAWIEDIVVSESARGQGVGSALVRHAMAQAKDRGAHQIGLSSSPRRVAANRLYQKIGFEERPTHVYHFTFAQEPK